MPNELYKSPLFESLWRHGVAVWSSRPKEESSKLLCLLGIYVASHRSHNPEAVRFKSHPRNQKRNSHHLVAVFFCPTAESRSLHFPAASGGGRGLGARARLNGDEARVTREKTRSNTRGTPSPNSATMFSIGQLKSHPRNQNRYRC